MNTQIPLRDALEDIRSLLLAIKDGGDQPCIPVGDGGERWRTTNPFPPRDYFVRRAAKLALDRLDEVERGN